MEIDPKSQSFQDNHKLMIGSIVPRPIAFVSTKSPDNILNLSLDRAAELINQGASATAVLKELGEHNGKKIIIKNGRYGIYVTNGKVNVTLPKENDYNTLDLDTAINMIKNKKPKKKKFKRK